VTVTIRNLTNMELRFDGAGLELEDYVWGPVTSGTEVLDIPDAVRFSAAIVRALAAGKMSIIGDDVSQPIINAYDIAVDNGFVGSQEAWLASLVGPEGPPGSPGAPGEDGADGRTVLSGIGAPSNGIGLDGDFYVNLTVPSMYGPKTAGVWGSSFSLVGPQGPQGTQGPQGIQGVKGDTGNTGPQGIQGDAGPTGATGSQGPAGRTVLNGQGSPSLAIGGAGDFYIDTDADAIYGPKAATWGVATPLVGPAGLSAPAIATFTVPGQLVTGLGEGRFYFWQNRTVTRVLASVGIAPTGSSVIADVNKNGTTIFTAQAGRPTIPASQYSDTNSTPDVAAFAPGDYITVDVDQIGSTNPGSDLVVQVEYQ
jgi:hypothetical protein